MERVPVQVGPDYRIFVLFAALNHYGYALKGEPEMAPVRLAIRRRLAEQPGAGLESEREWMQGARPFYPRVGLMQVYSLHQRDWPAAGPGPFSPGEAGPFLQWLESNRLELPGDAPGEFFVWLAGLGPRMEAFAGRMGLAAIWEQYLDPHSDQGGRMAAAVRGELDRATSLLALRSWPFSTVRVITNLLQSSWLADQVLIGTCLYAVIAGPDPALASSVAHEALHLAVRPLVLELWPCLEDWTGHASCERLRRRMEPQGYWGLTPAAGLYRAIQEALVRAATIAASAESANQLASRAQAQADRGFTLVPSLARFLATRSRSPLTSLELAGALTAALNHSTA